jgi:flagellin
MGLTIFTNVASLNAQRSLSRNSKGLSVNYERLSSGLRINSAKDDAAGLAISERFGAQVRGLNQAARNANDAISLAKTAEGGLIETTSNLQRLRELAVQAANDTYTASDRAAIQTEVDQLIEEIDRVASQTQFNGQNLLDGSYNNRVFQIGANAGQTISFSINAATSSVMGAISTVTSANVSTNNLVFGELLINGVDVPNSSATDDTLSPVTFASASAIAKAAAINSVSATTNVTAQVDANVVNGGPVTSGTYAAGDLLINGVNIGPVTTTAGDSTGALRNAINAITTQTGVVASLDGTNNLLLTAADGRNIEIGGANPGAVTTLAAGTTTSTITLESDAAISITGTAPTNAGFAGGVTAVNLAVNVGASTLTTQSSATTAIGVFDTALRQVANVRADLGAILNRLDSTVNSLGIASENLDSARSQIMDADFASETASYSRNQILQQASTAMLAQANVSGQIALQLLGN